MSAARPSLRERGHSLLRRPAAVLAVLQIAAILVTGAVTAVRFHIFAAVDERADVAYVQEVAEHGRLPRLAHDYVSWQVEAIADNTYPRHSTRDPRRLGLAGLSYEAFQPPLYYALAAPAFLLTGNYRDKVIAVRLFNLLLLIAALAIVAALARSVFAERWLLPYCLALAVLMWPGVIVRSITVSNAALEMPIVALFLLVTWHATVRRKPWLLLAAGAVLGLCVLTKLTWVCLAPLLLAPILALLRVRSDRRAVLVVIGTLALPLVLLAPWLASNESRYGALTPSGLAKQVQEPYVNPTHKQFGVQTVISRAWQLERGVLPQEWWAEYDNSLLGAIMRLLPILLVLGGIVPMLLRPRLLRSAVALILGAPLPLALATLVGIVVLAAWPSFLPRYAYATAAPFALFVAWGCGAVSGRRNPLLPAAAAGSLIAAFLWVYMAGAYYFTNIGATLGIHAHG